VMLVTFLTFTMSRPYVLRYAKGFGGTVIGLAVALNSLASITFKVLGTSRVNMDSAKLSVLGGVLLSLSYLLPIFGVVGYLFYEIFNGLAFSMILIVTLVVVAELAEPSRLGFHYGIRGTALSAAGFVGPLIGILLYDSGGLLWVLLASSIFSLLLIPISLNMGGVRIYGGGDFKVSRRWVWAFLTSLLLASSFLIISTYLPPYQALKGVPHEVTSLFFSARALGSGVVRMPAGILADRASIAIAFPPVLAVLASALSSNALNAATSSLVGLLIGAAWGLTSPVVLSTAGRERQKTKSFGLFTVGWDIAQLTVVPFAGFLANNSYSRALSIALVTSALSSLTFLSLYMSIRKGE